jgi:hypothetical protein
MAALLEQDRDHQSSLKEEEEQDLIRSALDSFGRDFGYLERVLKEASRAISRKGTAED